MPKSGGVGLIVCNRKEGRALGEVTEFLVPQAPAKRRRRRRFGRD